jgi:hypothetical protein
MKMKHEIQGASAQVMSRMDNNCDNVTVILFSYLIVVEKNIRLNVGAKIKQDILL